MRAGYPSWGTYPRQWYTNRIAVWVALGCRTELAVLPILVRNTEICITEKCISSHHWDPVTDFLATIWPKIAASALEDIRQKTARLSELHPSHPILDDDWDSYLPTPFRERLRK